jgi:hypothetical protein
MTDRFKHSSLLHTKFLQTYKALYYPSLIFEGKASVEVAVTKHSSLLQYKIVLVVKSFIQP